MSIWSSFGGVEPLYKVGYYWDAGAVEPGSSLDFADAKSWYGSDALRVCLENGEQGREEGRATAVVSRDQVEEIVEQLQEWLARTSP